MYGEADRALRPCPRKARQSPDLTPAGRISFGIFFAETNGTQNMGNVSSNKYKGSLQTGVSEDQSGQRKSTGVSWIRTQPAGSR
jgi:hypothetical protein